MTLLSSYWSTSQQFIIGQLTQMPIWLLEEDTWDNSLALYAAVLMVHFVKTSQCTWALLTDQIFCVCLLFNQILPESLSDETCMLNKEQLYVAKFAAHGHSFLVTGPYL